MTALLPSIVNPSSNPKSKIQNLKSNSVRLVFEIDGGDVLADFAPEVCDLHVFGVDGVGVESGAVAEDGDEAGVVRARQAEHVRADGEALDLGDDADERAQPCDVFGAPLGADVGAVFP